MAADLDLRLTFNREAELYHAIRPHYPEALFDQLFEVTQLNRESRLLEIGPGTGQATQSVAKRGFDIIAVELGAELAAIARRAFQAYPNVQIVNAPFESVELPSDYFDLVYVATAFHWIEPESQFKKPHRLLKDDGYLAIITTTHISDEEGDVFPHTTQPIYKKYKPGGNYIEEFRLPQMSELRPFQIDDELFSPVYFNPFPLNVRYSAEEYAQLLNTYSPTLAMAPDSRSGFLDEIKRCIEEEFGGSILKHYAISLTVAKKK